MTHARGSKSEDTSEVVRNVCTESHIILINFFLCYPIGTLPYGHILRAYFTLCTVKSSGQSGPAGNFFVPEH